MNLGSYATQYIANDTLHNDWRWTCKYNDQVYCHTKSSVSRRRCSIALVPYNC